MQHERAVGEDGLMTFAWLRVWSRRFTDRKFRSFMFDTLAASWTKPYVKPVENADI